MNVAELGKQAFMAELKRGLEACGLPVTQVEQRHKGGKRQVWLCPPEVRWYLRMFCGTWSRGHGACLEDRQGSSGYTGTWN